MGRRRTYDPDEVVHRAMRVFWAQGYVATSWRELCAAMGIRSGSTHAAFGSKAALFACAVERYVADQRSALGEPGRAALSGWLDQVVADREPRGCLLVASASEGDALPAAAADTVRQAMTALDAFAWASLGGTAAVRADAAWLVATVTGLQVMHRAGVPGVHLSRIADRVRETLDIRAPTE